MLGLRELRERAGLHEVALAAMLKVPVQKLEALEAGRYDELPDLTFARALASSVCRALKADPAPVLAGLPQSGAVRLGESESAINSPFPVKQEVAMNSPVQTSSSWHKAAWAAAVLLLLALLSWWGLPWWMSPQEAQSVATDTVDAPASAVAEPAVPQPVNVPDEPVTAPALALAPSAAMPAPATAPEPSGVATASDAAPLFKVEARQLTWLQVKDVNGKVLLERNLPAGESASIATGGPLYVAVGRADAVDVTVRGQVMDLQPHSRNQVARFEVK